MYYFCTMFYKCLFPRCNALINQDVFHVHVCDNKMLIYLLASLHIYVHIQGKKYRTNEGNDEGVTGQKHTSHMSSVVNGEQIGTITIGTCLITLNCLFRYLLTSMHFHKTFL